MMKPGACNILITGGTGLIGKQLTQLMVQRGYNVSLLTRKKITGGTPLFKSNSPGNKVKCFHWDIEKGIIEDEALLTADYIIHLAGENIGNKRWTETQKEKIINSRVNSTQLLYEKISQLKIPLKGFISASGVGYCGAVTSEKIFTEPDNHSDDFLGEICFAWEKSVLRFQQPSHFNMAGGIRTVILRTGVVLSAEGGALPRMAKPVKYFAGAVLGSGRQYVPWIHIDDLCSIYIYAIENNLPGGVYNGVAPEHITMKELIRKIANALHRPLLLPPVPEVMLKFLLGEMAGMVLCGSRVSCEKILKEGFRFRYDTAGEAFGNIFR